MNIDSSTPSRLKDTCYRVLPTLPIIAVLVMLTLAAVVWQRKGQQLDAAIDTFVVNEVVVAAPPEHTEHTDRWLAVLRAKEALNAKYGNLSDAITDDPSGQYAVPPGEPLVTEPIVDQYAADAAPIIKALKPIVDVGGPIWVPTVNEGMGTVLNEMELSRGISRLLLMEFASAFHDNDRPRALFALKAAGRLYAPTQQPEFMVAELVRLASLAGPIKVAAQSLQYDQWSDDDLSEIEQALLSKTDLEARWRNMIQGEGQWVLRSLSEADLMGPYQSNEVGAPLPVISPSSKLAMVQHYRRAQSTTKDLGSLSHRDGLQDRDPIGLHHSFSLDQWLSTPTMLDSFQLNYLLPSFWSFSGAFAQHDAQVNLARTALATRRYRRANGDWPDSLADLSSVGLPKSQTIDPFGNPLEFEQIDGDRLKVSIQDYPEKHPGHILSVISYPLVFRPGSN